MKLLERGAAKGTRGVRKRNRITQRGKRQWNKWKEENRTRDVMRGEKIAKGDTH